jgi:hypothetical protein
MTCLTRCALAAPQPYCSYGSSVAPLKGRPVFVQDPFDAVLRAGA